MSQPTTKFFEPGEAVHCTDIGNYFGSLFCGEKFIVVLDTQDGMLTVTPHKNSPYLFDYQRWQFARS